MLGYVASCLGLTGSDHRPSIEAITYPCQPELTNNRWQSHQTGRKKPRSAALASAAAATHAAAVAVKPSSSKLFSFEDEEEEATTEEENNSSTTLRASSSTTVTSGRKKTIVSRSTSYKAASRIYITRRAARRSEYFSSLPNSAKKNNRKSCSLSESHILRNRPSQISLVKRRPRRIAMTNKRSAFPSCEFPSRARRRPTGTPLAPSNCYVCEANTHATLAAAGWTCAPTEAMHGVLPEQEPQRIPFFYQMSVPMGAYSANEVAPGFYCQTYPPTFIQCPPSIPLPIAQHQPGMQMAVQNSGGPFQCPPCPSVGPRMRRHYAQPKASHGAADRGLCESAEIKSMDEHEPKIDRRRKDNQHRILRDNSPCPCPSPSEEIEDEREMCFQKSVQCRDPDFVPKWRSHQERSEQPNMSVWSLRMLPSDCHAEMIPKRFSRLTSRENVLPNINEGTQTPRSEGFFTCVQQELYRQEKQRQQQKPTPQKEESPVNVSTQTSLVVVVLDKPLEIPDANSPIVNYDVNYPTSPPMSASISPRLVLPASSPPTPVPEEIVTPAPEYQPTSQEQELDRSGQKSPSREPDSLRSGSKSPSMRYEERPPSVKDRPFSPKVYLSSSSPRERLSTTNEDISQKKLEAGSDSKSPNLILTESPLGGSGDLYLTPPPSVEEADDSVFSFPHLGNISEELHALTRRVCLLEKKRLVGSGTFLPQSYDERCENEICDESADFANGVCEICEIPTAENNSVDVGIETEKEADDVDETTEEEESEEWDFFQSQPVPWMIPSPSQSPAMQRHTCSFTDLSNSENGWSSTSAYQTPVSINTLDFESQKSEFSPQEDALETSTPPPKIDNASNRQARSELWTPNLVRSSPNIRTSPRYSTSSPVVVNSMDELEKDSFQIDASARSSSLITQGFSISPQLVKPTWKYYTAVSPISGDWKPLSSALTGDVGEMKSSQQGGEWGENISIQDPRTPNTPNCEIGDGANVEGPSPMAISEDKDESRKGDTRSIKLLQIDDKVYAENDEDNDEKSACPPSGDDLVESLKREKSELNEESAEIMRERCSTPFLLDSILFPPLKDTPRSDEDENEDEISSAESTQQIISPKLKRSSHLIDQLQLFSAFQRLITLGDSKVEDGLGLVDNIAIEIDLWRLEAVTHIAYVFVVLFIFVLLTTLLSIFINF